MNIRNTNIAIISILTFVIVLGGFIYWYQRGDALLVQPPSDYSNSMSLSGDMSHIDTKSDGNQIKDTIKPEIKLIPILSDQIIATGYNRISDRAWASDSDKIFLDRNVGTTDIGLPAYITYDIYDLSSQNIVDTGIKNGITRGTPYWSGNSIVTQDQVATYYDNGNISISNNTIKEPSGFDLLDDVIYCNKNTQKCEKYVTALNFSPHNKYAAFISPYGSGGDVPYGYRLFIMPRYARSLDELINFGSVTMGVEVSEPEFRWSDDDRYLISQFSELFDIEKKKAIIPYGNGSKLTYFSPDQSSALSINLSTGNKVINLVNLPNGQVHQIDNITSNLFWIDGSFSPDSKYIVYTTGNKLIVYDIANDQKYILASGDNEYKYPRWSPDGNKIIYSTENDVRMIMLKYPDSIISS